MDVAIIGAGIIGVPPFFTLALSVMICNGSVQISELCTVCRPGLSIAYTLLERDANITVAITDHSGLCERGGTGAGAVNA